MRDNRLQDPLRRLLIQRGFSPAYATRMAQEFADHRQSLEDEAQENGLDPLAAQRQAAKRLGTPEELVHALVRSRRQSKWWGRHPILLFAVAPVVLLLLGFSAAALWITALGLRNGWWGDQAIIPRGTWMQLQLFVPSWYFFLMIVLPAFFCRLARQFHYGWAWAALSCSILSLHGWFHWINASFPLPGMRGQVIWAYGLSPHLMSHAWVGMPPFLILSLYAFLAQRYQQRIIESENAT